MHVNTNTILSRKGIKMDACRRLRLGNWDEFLYLFFFSWTYLGRPLDAFDFTLSICNLCFCVRLLDDDLVVFFGTHCNSVSRVALTKGKDKLWSLMSSRGGGGVVRRIAGDESEREIASSASPTCAPGMGTVNTLHDLHNIQTHFIT